MNRMISFPIKGRSIIFFLGLTFIKFSSSLIICQPLMKKFLACFSLFSCSVSCNQLFSEKNLIFLSFYHNFHLNLIFDAIINYVWGFFLKICCLFFFLATSFKNMVYRGSCSCFSCCFEHL